MLESLLYFVIIAGCGGTGLFKAYEYRERELLLEELIKMLRAFRTELIYRRDPLPSLIKRIGEMKSDSAHFLCLTVHGLYEDGKGSFGECWLRAAETVYGASALHTEDIKALADFGAEIGLSSVNEQEKIFMLYIAELEDRLAEAIRDKRTRGKMYTGLGFVVGITIAIIMI